MSLMSAQISWNPFSRELARTMLRFEDAEQAGLEAGKNWVDSDGWKVDAA